MGLGDLSGRTLGKYELRRILGVGGMGAVYLGYQRDLDREVAIKVLPTALAAEPAQVQDFNREAKIVAGLEHVHIVPIYDYGTQDDLHYIVMRLLTGGSLASVLEQRRFTLEETSKLLRQLADALDYAHASKVIHRDIKPSNVMFDQMGNAYLVDFGIAKWMTTSGEMTRTSNLRGTPSFMAPELWSGEMPSTATDIYALGVLAYQAVTGQPPFDAPSPYALMMKHLYEKPALAHTVLPNLPRKLDAVLGTPLSKKPHQRYRTAADFVQAFQAAAAQSVMEHTPRVTTKPSLVPPFIEPTTELSQAGVPTVRMSPFERLPRVALLPLVLILLLVLVGIAAALNQPPQPPPPTEISWATETLVTPPEGVVALVTEDVASTAPATTEAPLVPPPTLIPSDTLTPSDTPTRTSTPTPTDTPTRTPTDTPTRTSSPVPSDTPTRTPSPAPSDTPTRTPSATAAPTEIPNVGPATPASEETEGNLTGGALITYMQLDLQAGEAVSICLNSNDFDSTLSLRDPSGKEVAKNDDYGGTDDSCIMHYIAQVSGVHTVVITSFDGHSTGSYTLETTLFNTCGQLPVARVIVDEANLRSAPSASGDFIGMARRNDCFPVIARSENLRWWKIQTADGREVWVSATVVEIIGNSEETPLANP
jgi:serine/threonine protein kinase